MTEKMKRPDKLIAIHLGITEVKPTVHARMSAAEFAEVFNESHELAKWIDVLEARIKVTTCPRCQNQFGVRGGEVA